MKPTKRPAIDFGQFFGVDHYQPIDFRTRGGPDGLHDIIYLSSYVHDARFTFRDIERKANRLTINLRRDTWETYQRADQLKTVSSSLTIEPVGSLAWRFGGQLAASAGDLRKAELSIEYLTVDHTRTDPVLSLGNSTEGFELQINFGGEWPVLRLRDARSARH